MTFYLESSQIDRARFDEAVRNMIYEDQEVSGYDVEQYADELVRALDIGLLGTEDADATWLVDDLDEAYARIRAVVSVTLPQEQADREEAEAANVEADRLADQAYGDL